MMDHTKYTFLAAILVVILITASSKAVVPELSEITGAFTYTPPEKEDSTYAYLLNDWMNGFFDIRGVAWPEGACTDVARELYNSIAYGPVTVTEHISTYGPQRVSNVMFGLEQEHAGAIEMVHGRDLLKNYGVDSALHIYAESVVRIPHADRASEINIDLFGNSADMFYLKYGAVQTPILRCAFEVTEGEANCDCEYVHQSNYRY